jgi:translation initiation factor 4G
VYLCFSVITRCGAQALTKMSDVAAREEAERAVKKRTMGNMRLISELYKQDMVKDWIMTACMEDLLLMTGHGAAAAAGGKGATRVPPEDNIEVRSQPAFGNTCGCRCGR